MNRRMWAVVAPLATIFVTLAVFLSLHFLGAGKTAPSAGVPAGASTHP